MRISSLALLIGLTACQSQPTAGDKTVEAPAGEAIDCALGDGAMFAHDCALERGDGHALTLRHADGGFRKLTLDSDGMIDTADGADEISVQPLADGRTEIGIGSDRYRLPAGL